MITYVNTVLVSNLATGAILDAEPAAAANMATASADAGKFIIMNCDPNVAADKLYEVTAANAGAINKIKIGIVTKKNTAVRMPDGSTEYRPIIKWSNEIKSKDVRSYNVLSYQADTEDAVVIDFANLDESKLVDTTNGTDGGKRIVVRLTYKDMPHRYRKWTESYEYVTSKNETNASIAKAIADMINREWKRARVSVVTGTYTPGQSGAPGTFAAGANGEAI